MGLTIDKVLVILVIAMLIVGPERLPVYAKKLGELVKNLKHMADGAKGRLREEMGPEFDDVDWKQLDPRQYDPRRIIRDALLEDEREAKQRERRERAAQAARTGRIGGPPVGEDSPRGARTVGGVAAAGAAVAEGSAAEPAPSGAEDPSPGMLRFDEEAT